MYDFATLDRLPIYRDGSGEALDDLRLPPVKVLGRAPGRPEVEVDYTFEKLSTLVGFDVDPGSDLEPGEVFTVTLYHQSTDPTAEDLVRFVQLYSPEYGVVAQWDSPPADGHNPTWSWLPGEVIADPVVLHLRAEAPAGRYGLYAGFYAPDDGKRRTQVYAGGRRIDGDWALLGEVAIR
jgi:hypothetical protein